MEINQIYNVDCIKGLKEKVIDESVDLVIADPPYFKVVNEKWDYFWRTEEDYLDWTKKYLSEVYRVLRKGGSFYLFGYFRMLIKIVPILEDLGFELRQQIVINKGLQSISGRATKNYKMFPNVTESILFLYKDSKPFVKDFLKSRQKDLGLTAKEINDRLGVKSNGGGMWSIYTGKNVCKQLPTKEIWNKLQEILLFDIPYNKISQTFNSQMGITDVWNDINFYSEKRIHPTQKPQSCIDRLILASSNEGDIVLDPFMGSGSYAFPKDNEFKFALETKPIYTLLGSKKTKYILYELEKKVNSKEIQIYSEGTIEHIMPQTLSNKWRKDLSNLNDLSNYESYLHLLGNLTLTGYNSELGNETFEKKKLEYIKSNYANTRQIVKYKNWSSKEIKERGKYLIDICLKLWELPEDYNKQNNVSIGIIYNLETDFNLFTNTKPAEVNFIGGTTKVKNWNELVASVLTDCYTIDNWVFLKLLNYNGFYGNKVYLNTSSVNMTNPIEIEKSGIYVDTGNSVVVNLRLIEKVLEFYDEKKGSDLVKDFSFTLSKV